MSYQDDKRELLKLKQGIIEESETITEAEKPKYEVHGFKRVENFFYHYKWHVVAGLFAAAVLTFLIHSLVTKEQGDMRVLLVTKNPEVADNVTFRMSPTFAEVTFVANVTSVPLLSTHFSKILSSVSVSVGSV